VNPSLVSIGAADPCLHKGLLAGTHFGLFTDYVTLLKVNDSSHDGAEL